MTDNVVVKPATVSDRILICTKSGSDCVAVDVAEVGAVIEELEQYQDISVSSWYEQLGNVRDLYVKGNHYEIGGDYIQDIEVDQDVKRGIGDGWTTCTMGRVTVEIETEVVQIAEQFSNSPEICFSDDGETLYIGEKA